MKTLFTLFLPAVDAHQCPLQEDHPRQRLLMGRWLINCQTGLRVVKREMRKQFINAKLFAITIAFTPSPGLRTLNWILVFLLYECLQIHWRKCRLFWPPNNTAWRNTSCKLGLTAIKRDPVWQQKRIIAPSHLGKLIPIVRYATNWVGNPGRACAGYSSSLMCNCLKYENTRANLTLLMIYWSRFVF